MANVLKQFYGATAPNTLTTVYTVPAGKQAIIREISLCNITGTEATATIKLNDKSIVYTLPIPAGYPFREDYHQILEAGQTIKVQAGTASAIDMLISGLEVS